MKNYRSYGLLAGSLGALVLSTAAMAEGADRTDLQQQYPQAQILQLEETTAFLDGVELETYDYTWHCDRSTVHDEVKDAPAEYHTGELPEELPDCYIDHDLPYYPWQDENDFSLVNYDGEQEWVCYYADGENDEYIWGTLPMLGRDLPTDMMHTSEEAAQNQVLHITKAGEYILRGNWSGQIRVDLGEEAFDDENCKVTLILAGADIHCTAAPGVIFENVYECDHEWEERESYGFDVDTSQAGAVVRIAAGTENTVTGQNVFRMLKTKYKDEESSDPVKTQKKLRKTDGALYSYMTMNIEGTQDSDNGLAGKLTVNSGFEGIDSELHLSVYGGDITVNSQDDGMNVNEDHVSLISFLGGSVTIHAALGQEGDGVDSNGYIKVDGGTVKIDGIRVPDSALDSEDGVLYTSGKVLVDGEEIDCESGSIQREIGGGMMEGGKRPSEFKEGEQPPEFKEGEQPPKFEEGKQPPRFAEGEQPPERPDGNKPLQFGQGGNLPEKPEGE